MIMMISLLLLSVFLLPVRPTLSFVVSRSITHEAIFRPNDIAVPCYPRSGTTRATTGSFPALYQSSGPNGEDTAEDKFPLCRVAPVIFDTPDEVKANQSRVIPPGFKLSMEFEFFGGDGSSWDIHDEFSFVYVYLPDGRGFSLNVWTYGFFKTAIQEYKHDGYSNNGTYLTPPDLFVEEMTRECIEPAIADLLTDYCKDGRLEDALNPSILDNYDAYSKRRILWKRFAHTVWWTWRRIRKKLGLAGKGDWDCDYYTLIHPNSTLGNTNLTAKEPIE